MNIKIKKINSDDIKILQKISIETFTDTFGEQNSPENLKNYLEKAFNSKKLLSELSNPFSYFYLIYFDKEPAGYLKLNIGKIQSEKIGEETLEIERIYIRKKFQRNRLGNFLLNKALSRQPSRFGIKNNRSLNRRGSRRASGGPLTPTAVPLPPGPARGRASAIPRPAAGLPRPRSKIAVASRRGPCAPHSRRFPAARRPGERRKFAGAALRRMRYPVRVGIR